jgi:hypothetical protein
MSNLYCPEMDDASLIQNKNVSAIQCKYCGCLDHPHVKKANPPHAYRVDCAHCGRFYKWGSAIEIEKLPSTYIYTKVKEFERLAIDAAKNGDEHTYFKYIAMRDKYYEQL